LFTIGLGTQFGFDVPMSPVKPYVGLELLFSTISGSAKFQGTQNVQSSSIDMETASRTGLGFSAGAEIKIISMALDVSLKYNLINLFSKNYDGPINATTRDEVYNTSTMGRPQYSAKENILLAMLNYCCYSVRAGILFDFKSIQKSPNLLRCAI
jgi:hypothetical protein